MESKDAGRALVGNPSEDARREAARLLGSIRTEKKLAAASDMGRRYGNRNGRPVKPLAEIACTCGVGDGLEGHKATCLRRQAIKRRQQRGLPLE